MQHIQYILKWL